MSAKDLLSDSLVLGGAPPSAKASLREILRAHCGSLNFLSGQALWMTRDAHVQVCSGRRAMRMSRCALDDARCA